jgi:CheY-like chemotaxis protein
MRPKKTVVCVTAGEAALSLRAMQLETWGYCVVRAGSAKEARAALTTRARWPYSTAHRAGSGGVDAVLIDAPLPGAVGLLRAVREMCPDTRVLVASSAAAHDADLEMADVYVFGEAARPMQVRERLRVLTARRRGPAPMHGKKPVLNATAMIAQERWRA